MSWEFEQKFTTTVAAYDPGTYVVNGEGHYVYTSAPMPNLSGVYTDSTSIWSGRDLWVITSNTRCVEVSGLNVWDPANIDRDKLSYHYYFDNNTHGIRHSISRTTDANGKISNVFYHSAGSAKISATKWYNKIYVAHGSQDICVFDIETHLASETVLTLPVIVTSLPATCNGPATSELQLDIGSNVCASNGKLFVSTQVKNSTDQQYLCIYNIATQVWSYILLPGRFQTPDRHIIDGLDGYVWITNRNNHAIIKVDTSTNAVVATIRVNRHPYRMSVNQGKDLYVASDPGGNVTRKDYTPELATGLVGMTGGGHDGYVAGANAFEIKTTIDTTDGQISWINQTTNAQDAYAAARCNGEIKDLDFFDDGQGYLWFATDHHIGRLKKSDKEFKTSYTVTSNPSGDTAEPTVNMIPDNSEIEFALEGTYKSHVVSPQFHYEYWNGSAFVDTTVKPYIYVVSHKDTGAGDLLVTSISVQAGRLTALVRKNKYIHRGTAMIAIGDQAYYGD